MRTLRWRPTRADVGSPSVPGRPESIYGDAESKIRIVDATTGELIRVLAMPVGQVTDLSFQPGGDLLAVGTADAGLYVLDTTTGETVHSRQSRRWANRAGSARTERSWPSATVRGR